MFGRQFDTGRITAPAKGSVVLLCFLFCKQW